MNTSNETNKKFFGGLFKCHFCPYSHLNEEGTIECTWRLCQLSAEQLETMMKTIYSSKD